jgi:putative iron-regulated protein
VSSVLRIPPFPLFLTALPAALALAPPAGAQAPSNADAPRTGPARSDPDLSADELRRAVVAGHATWCHGIYARCEQRAKVLQSAVAKFLAEPDDATLAAARTEWIDARAVYGQTEALRFCDGPIEPLEPLLNAWPVDESFVDAIVADTASYPNLGATALVLANERGGEANVSVGWHAIEYLLWGKDLSPTGPGARPALDYLPGGGRHAERRREYLAVTTELLVQHLGELRVAWAPAAGNHRAAFERDLDGAVRRILTGVTVMSAFELCGERLGVAYETQDQEQEHSCFSDTSCQDLEANQLGIAAILGGEPAGGSGPGLLALVRGKSPALAADAAEKVAATLACLRAIPAPFDAAMRGSDDAPGRRAIAAAIAALERQTEVLTIVGRVLGHELPLKPGG